MKNKTKNPAEKGRVAALNSTRAKPADIDDAAEAKRVVRDGEAETAIRCGDEIRDPSLKLMPRELAVMVERLKTSREQAEKKDRLFGINAGEAFAMRRASYGMLVVIDAMVADYANSGCYNLEDGAETLVAELARQLEDRFDDSWELKDLAELLFHDSESKPSPAFLAAFVQGAAATWRQVEALV